MALRRTRPAVASAPPLVEHVYGHVIKHDEVLARLDKELRELIEKVERLERGMEHLADKVSKCITAVASIGEEKPTRALAPKPAPKPAPAKRAAANNRVYTADEIALAVMLQEQGATAAAIAAVLKRTERGIEGLLKRLRQGDSTIGQDRHAKRKAGK